MLAFYLHQALRQELTGIGLKLAEDFQKDGIHRSLPRAEK
jgi:hypothetical protein